MKLKTDYKVSDVPLSECPRPQFKRDSFLNLNARRVEPETLIKKGLCGAVYTQVSDVEEEINGLVTYDRKVQKVDTEFMKRLNSEINTEAEKIV